MTKVIIFGTFLVSILALYRQNVGSLLLFNPFLIYHRREWHRLITHGFVHADWWHLIINMFVLYSFGTAVENKFNELAYYKVLIFPGLVFIGFYFSWIIVSSLNTLRKHRNDINYKSVGASGAVSAVVFAGIFFEPLRKIYFYGIIGLPGIIIGILYLVYSFYMSRRSGDNINHDAHFIGAIYGFIFPLILDFKLAKLFIGQF